MTIPEVNNAIKAFNWRENRQHQFIASIAYKMPTLIAISILDAKNYPEIYEVFPTEYDEQDVKNAKQNQQIKKDVATFQAWAESFNRRMERNE